MKKILIVVALFTAFIYGVNAQQKEEQKPYIEVTGSAELKVVPDEIYLSILLNEKDVKDRRSVASLEKDLVAVLRNLHIPVENLSISGANSKLEKAFWTGKRIYARKNYILKLTSANDIGQVLRDLEAKGISNVNLSHVDNSQMEKYRKEVKIKAMKAAKEKADYLLNAIGEKTGKPLLIQERNYRSSYYANAPMAMRMRSKSNGVRDYSLDFQEMVLTYEIFARFEIAK